jgi:hypothetical protein
LNSAWIVDVHEKWRCNQLQILFSRKTTVSYSSNIIIPSHRVLLTLLIPDHALTVSAVRLTLVVSPGGPPNAGAICICSLPGGAASWVVLEGEVFWASTYGTKVVALNKSAVKACIPGMWGVSQRYFKQFPCLSDT